jgi:hypothetical protein
MHFQCLIGRHTAAPDEIRNQGFGFSHCRRCSRDMVRSKNEWRSVPRGFQVVWRRRPPLQTEISAAQLLFDLPASGRALLVPPGRGRNRPMGLLFLVQAGLRHLSWTAGRRLLVWRGRLQAARRVDQSVIRLPQPELSGSLRPAS